MNGGNPVAMIFAREVSAPLTSLVKKIDAANVENKKKKMGSFVVFLSDKEGLKDELSKLAKTESLKHTVLSLDNPAGPKGYEVAKEADVTVVLYTNRKVVANHAFRKGELNEKAIDRIMADVPKIFPEK
jgi:hypothetical protein